MKGADLHKAWLSRAPRERLLLVVVAIGVLAAVVDGLWTAPLGKRLKRATQETQALQDRLQAQQAAQAGKAGQAAQLREQEARLRQRLQAAASDLRQRVAEASRLPQTLRTLTATVGSARLLELNLSGDGAALPAADAASAAAPRRLYRLPVTLKASGSYEELQRLLAQIEHDAQALQWSSVMLDGSDWPAIQLTLKAHVLSLDPRWGAL
jgi:type II secretory pathway pseudopilin PulG